jgi:hypothetical protein
MSGTSRTGASCRRARKPYTFPGHVRAPPSAEFSSRAAATPANTTARRSRSSRKVRAAVRPVERHQVAAAVPGSRRLTQPTRARKGYGGAMTSCATVPASCARRLRGLASE